MKNRIVLALSSLLLCAGLTGCNTIKQNVTPAVVKQGVAAIESAAVSKWPTAIPYLQAAAPIVCMTAYGTNLAPSQVIAALENSSIAALKTPEAALIMNGVLTLYVAVWESYGADAVNNEQELKLYLQATCDGMNAGLPNATKLALPIVFTAAPEWPLIQIP